MKEEGERRKKNSPLTSEAVVASLSILLARCCAASALSLFPRGLPKTSLPPPNLNKMGAASKLAQLVAHPSEFFPVVEMALAARRAKALPALKADPSLAFCYDMLNKVSRRYRFDLEGVNN